MAKTKKHGVRTEEEINAAFYKLQRLVKCQPTSLRQELIRSRMVALAWVLRNTATLPIVPSVEELSAAAIRSMNPF
jgi:hypothetical protein